MNNKEYLIERLKKAKIEISDQQCSQLLKYMSCSWNVIKL